jgi:hypothetical protein
VSIARLCAERDFRKSRWKIIIVLRSRIVRSRFVVSLPRESRRNTRFTLFRSLRTDLRAAARLITVFAVSSNEFNTFARYRLRTPRRRIPADGSRWKGFISGRWHFWRWCNVWDGRGRGAGGTEPTPSRELSENKRAARLSVYDSAKRTSADVDATLLFTLLSERKCFFGSCDSSETASRTHTRALPVPLRRQQFLVSSFRRFVPSFLRDESVTGRFFPQWPIFRVSQFRRHRFVSLNDLIKRTFVTFDVHGDKLKTKASFLMTIR